MGGPSEWHRQVWELSTQTLLTAVPGSCEACAYLCFTVCAKGAGCGKVWLPELWEWPWVRM